MDRCRAACRKTRRRLDMKQLMLGNKAVARGLYDAGCCFASSYPGTPSTEITEEIAKFDDVYSEWAPNEKVAMEAAFGACLAGARSFCGMKHVGLNVAADPLYTMSYTGVNAGMVIGVPMTPACIPLRMSRTAATTPSRPKCLCSSLQTLRKRTNSRNWHIRSQKILIHRSS